MTRPRRDDRTRRGALQRHALAQHGYVTRAQALACGYPSSTIAAYAAAGRWVAAHPGVYRDAFLPETWEGRVMAACLAVGPDAVVAGRAAGRMWRLPGLDRCDAVEVLVPRLEVPDLGDGITVRGTATLAPDHAVPFGSFLVTTCTRTIWDLAGSLPDAVHLEVAAEAYRLGRTDPERLAERLDAFPRHPGNRQLRRTVRELDPSYRRARSVFEIRAHRWMRGAGIDGYVLNHPVRLSSGRRVEFDVFFDPKVLELDGDRYHGRTTQQERDAQRDVEAKTDGYDVHRIPWTDDRDGFLAEVRGFLAAPPPEPGAP